MSFARFFKSVQDAPWYGHFLAPAVDELRTLPAGASVLDVGTGAGKFIEIVQASLPLQCVGTDTDATMLAQARQRTALKDVPLHRVLPGAPFPFARGTFDAVCFCSVLFLQDEPLALVQEAMRVLRPGGRIVTLTPTGNGSMQDGLRLLARIGGPTPNWTFSLWRNMTAPNARRWMEQGLLALFAEEKHLHYSAHGGFEGFAAIEILEQDPHRR